MYRFCTSVETKQHDVKHTCVRLPTSKGIDLSAKMMSDSRPRLSLQLTWSKHEP